MPWQGRLFIRGRRRADRHDDAGDADEVGGGFEDDGEAGEAWWKVMVGMLKVA
jgi:hypothetical protein